MARIMFTSRGLTALPIPEKGQVDFYDLKTVGLGIRVSYGGTKTFFIKYQDPREMHKGKPKQRRKSLKSYPLMTLAEARKKALDFRHSLIINGVDPEEAERQKKTEPTFKELADVFIEEYSKKKKRSWYEDQRILNKYFHEWEDRKAADITRKDAVVRIGEIASQHGGTMANHCLSCIRMLFKWGYKTDLIPAYNPTDMIDRPQETIERERVYSADELKVLWEAFGQMGRMGRIFRLLTLTGQRSGEICKLKWAYITDEPNGRDKIFTIPKSVYKTDRTHVVPLSEMALSIVEAMPIIEGNDFVFASPQIKNRGSAIYNENRQEVRKRSGVEDFRPHDLRRTFATNVAPLGFSADLGDRVMGHVMGKVSRTYNRYDYLPEKRALLEAWARYIASITGEGGNVVPLARLDVAAES